MPSNSLPWVRHYESEVPDSLTYENVPLHALLKSASQEFPTSPALHFLGKTFTYAQLFHEVNVFSRVLQSLGVKKGERVAIMLPNCPQAVIAYYAALQVGAVVVQTNPMYMERELEHQLRDSEATMMICVDLVYDKVAAVLPRTKLNDVIVTSMKDYLPFPKNVLYPLKLRQEGVKLNIPSDSSVSHWSELIKRQLPDRKEVDVDPQEDLALLQYTGGTTGLAKGVMLTHYNLVANTQQVRAWCYRAQRGKERLLAVLPFFHVYGMTAVMNFAMMIAAELILLPKFEPDTILKTVNKLQPTLFPGAPTMYVGLLHHPDLQKYNVGSIKVCISGAAPLPREVQQQFENMTGGRLVEGYGLTEASPVTHVNPIWGERKSGSIGIPLPDTDCQVIDPDTGERQPQGEIGELAVRGPQVMKGYWNRPEETADALRGGWLHTGDMATMDADGYFHIVDRKKDIIVAGGFNIYPREVEEVLYAHEAVQECAVIGVADSYRGETVKAFVVIKEGRNVTAGELERFCRDRLSAFKVPRLYEFRQELPKTLVGKVLRRVLVEEEAKKKSHKNEQDVRTAGKE